MIIPNRIISKAEAIRGNLAEPWAKNQIDRYLSDLISWIRHGYQFTEKQRETFAKLAELLETKGQNDAL